MGEINTPEELLQLLKEENKKLLSNCKDLNNIPSIILTTEESSNNNIVLTYEKDKRFPERQNPVYYLQNKENQKEKPTVINEDKLLVNIKMHFDYLKGNYAQNIHKAYEKYSIEVEEDKKEEKKHQEKKTTEKNKTNFSAKIEEFLNTKMENQTPQLVDQIFGNKNELKSLEPQKFFDCIKNVNPQFLKEEHIYNAIDCRLESFKYLPENLKSQKVCEYALDSILRSRFLANVINKDGQLHDGKENPIRAAHIINNLIKSIPKAIQEMDTIKKKIEGILEKYEIEKILQEGKNMEKAESKKPDNKDKKKKDQEKKTTGKENNEQKKNPEDKVKENRQEFLSAPVKKENLFRRIIRFIKELIENYRYNKLVKYNDNISFEREYDQMMKKEMKKEEKEAQKKEKEKAIEQEKQKKVTEIEKAKHEILSNEKSAYNQIMKLSQLAVGKSTTLVVQLNNGYMKMTPTGSTVRIEVGKNEVKETATGGFAAKFRETDLITFKSLGKYPKTDLAETLDAITKAGGIKSPENEIEHKENEKKSLEQEPENKIDKENGDDKNKGEEHTPESCNMKNYPFYELAKRDIPVLGDETIDKAIEIFGKKEIQGKNNDVIYKLPEGKAIVIKQTNSGPGFYIQDKKNDKLRDFTKENYEKYIQPLLKEPAPLVNQQLLNKDSVEYVMEKMVHDSIVSIEKDKENCESKRGNIKSEIFRDKDENHFIILSTYKTDKGQLEVKGVYKSLSDDTNFNINMEEVTTRGEDVILENKDALMKRISQFEYQIVDDVNKKEEYAKAFDIPMEELKEETCEINCAANTTEREELDKDILNESMEYADEEKSISEEIAEDIYDDRFSEPDIEDMEL